MKFMKLGNQPDSFLTEEATRTVISDVPSDITIRIKKKSYLLHKYPLVPKSGLLQRIETEFEESIGVSFDLHDIPGGEEAFELCAKFCYGITISLSAYNIVPALCAAKFLEMTEAVKTGNFCTKLEAFFASCILQGWKDSIVALQKTTAVYQMSENLGIVRKCIESIVDKILTPSQKVSWSYTYTRPGYDRKRRQSIPRDWWTEDVSFLDIDTFRCLLTAVKSTNLVPAQLIGEALHVYTRRWLPDIITAGSEQESAVRKRRILEIVVSLIPAEKGSVSFKFLIRLLDMANFLGVSRAAKAELLRLSSAQVEDASVADLLLPARTFSYGVDLFKAVLESFLRRWRRAAYTDENRSMRSIERVGKLVDSYLQVVSKDGSIPVQKVVSLAEMLPETARTEHDGLYKAIAVYLKEHPNLSKTDKKQLCGILDCEKLSPKVRAHAAKNESLPLRMVVHLLFFEHEKDGCIRDDLNKVKLSENHDHESGGAKGNQNLISGTSSVRQNSRKPSKEQRVKPELSFKIRESPASEMLKGKETGLVSGIQRRHPRKNAQERKS